MAGCFEIRLFAMLLERGAAAVAAAVRVMILSWVHESSVCSLSTRSKPPCTSIETREPTSPPAPIVTEKSVQLLLVQVWLLLLMLLLWSGRDDGFRQSNPPPPPPPLLVLLSLLLSLLYLLLLLLLLPLLLVTFASPLVASDTGASLFASSAKAKTSLAAAVAAVAAT